MADEKKRFPWWLVGCAALLVPLATVVGFIETVGRQGTIVGRYERIKDGMSEVEVLRILGLPSADDGPLPHDMRGQMEVWAEGPMYVIMAFDDDRRGYGKNLIKRRPEKGERHAWWRVRRWAERGYTAIHGPRR